MTMPPKFQFITILHFFLRRLTALNISVDLNVFLSYAMCAAWWIGDSTGDMFHNDQNKTLFPLALDPPLAATSALGRKSLF